MDKTYTETLGKPTFDWRQFLLNAIQNEPSMDEYREARDLASEFTTCAVAGQCAIIPRFKSGDRWANGAPKDSKLRDLGCDFYDHIGGRRWGSALDTLVLIEERSIFLIAEELQKLQLTHASAHPL